TTKDRQNLTELAHSQTTLRSHFPFDRGPVSECHQAIQIAYEQDTYAPGFFTRVSWRFGLGKRLPVLRIAHLLRRARQSRRSQRPLPRSHSRSISEAWHDQFRVLDADERPKGRR